MDRLVFLYDGDCGFCMTWVDRLRKCDRDHRVEWLSFHDEARRKRYPLLTLEDFQKGGYVIQPDGRIFQGAEAAPHLLRVLSGWKWIAWVFSVPGVMPVARWIYSRIARHRHRWGSGQCGREIK